MDRSLRTHASFLRLMYATHSQQRKALIQTLSEEQLHVLSKVIYNVYKGTLPLSRYYVKKLTSYRKDIETVINRNVGKKQKLTYW